MTSANYDPNAWKYESDDIDEYWIAGPLDLSSAEIVKRQYRMPELLIPREQNVKESTNKVDIQAHREGDTVWLDYFEVTPKKQGLGSKKYFEWEKNLPSDIKQIRLVASDAGEGPSHNFWDQMGFDYVYDDDSGPIEMVKQLSDNVMESTNKPTIGINVRSDGNTDYASLIVDGKKKYESRKTDSLRPYVGRTVGIVRTGNGPAVAIGQVTIGEPIVVDAEKFDKLRKQHLVPQGSLFDIGANDTKYLYPMINPIRWDNEKLIKNKGIVARKIQEQELTEFDYNKHVKMLNDYMQKLGYSYIGHGTDAHVFAKEEGPVVKVLIPENGDISTAKNPFLAFLNYCEKNANNPHLPKFIETTKQPIQLGSEKFDQVVMERLEELDPDYDEMIIDMMYSIDEGRPLDPQYRQYASFYKTLKSVIATGTKLGFSNDIIAHDYSNVMQRGDTLVIADPWVSAGLKEELSEGLIDFVQRKLGLKWGQAGDVIKGSVVAEYLDSQGDTIDSDKYINSKFKLMNINGDEAEKYREISDRSGWPSNTPYEKIKDWGIDDYKMNRIRRNDVTYQSLMKHIPVVSKRGFIINGNHRIARAIELGIDPIPVLKEI